jgi:hypothetical protein
MTWHYCNPVQACDYRTKYNTCSGTCLGTRYKACWYAFLKYGRNPSCGTETYAYACTYNCNPYTEAYNCRTNYECGTYQECNNVNYDCSYYQTITGYYTGTCSSSRTICDTATDYDNCITWSERQVAYDCSEMKLNNYGISQSNEKIGTPILAIFNISGCSGAVNYELYMKNANIKGAANCGFNSLEITPASAGTQTVLLKLNDGKTSISKIIGTILITNPSGETDSINPFIPAGETFAKSAESGAYDAKIMEWIKQELSNEDILKNLMITFGAVGLAITATQANRIRNYIENMRNNINPTISKNIKNLGQILSYLGLGVIVTGSVLTFLGASVPMGIVLGLTAILGVTGSLLEYLSHPFALNIELKDEKSKKIYAEEHAVEMSLDTAFLLLDLLTMGQGGKISKEIVEEAIERVTKDSVEESVMDSVKEIVEEIFEKSLKEGEEEVVERVVKDSMSPILTLLKNRLAKYISEEALDYFTFYLSKESDETIEFINKLLANNPELIKILSKPELFYNLINIFKTLPKNEDTLKLLNTMTINSLEFFKKYGKLPIFRLVKELEGESPCEFLVKDGETIIELSVKKISDLTKYSEFLIQHELKHYEYYIKGADYTVELMKTFDKNTAEQINNILIDAQIDAELAAANPLIKEQIKEYEEIYFKTVVGNSDNLNINKENILNFAKLFYESEISSSVDNAFKTATNYISLNAKYMEWYNRLIEVLGK